MGFKTSQNSSHLAHRTHLKKQIRVSKIQAIQADEVQLGITSDEVSMHCNRQWASCCNFHLFLWTLMTIVSKCQGSKTSVLSRMKSNPSILYSILLICLASSLLGLHYSMPSVSPPMEANIRFSSDFCANEWILGFRVLISPCVTVRVSRIQGFL